MPLEFDFNQLTIEGGLSIPALIKWIGNLHSEMTDNGLLPHGVSDQTHNELMVFANLADSFSEEQSNG